MARKRILTLALGQRLLQSKLDVLTGAGGRRPSLALSVLTGGVPEARPAEPPLPRRQLTPRTVYLSERHLRALDAIVEAHRPSGGKRLSRSAVLRQAIDHLCAEAFSNPHAPALEHPEHA